MLELLEQLFRQVRAYAQVEVWYPDDSLELRERKKAIIISGDENLQYIAHTEEAFRC